MPGKCLTTRLRGERRALNVELIFLIVNRKKHGVLTVSCPAEVNQSAHSGGLYAGSGKYTVATCLHTKQLINSNWQASGSDHS